MARRLVRKTGDAVLGGVAAGFGEYLDVDPVLIRLMFILLCIAGGSGMLLYLVCWLIMPRDVERYEGTASRSSPSADQLVDEMWQAGERVAGQIRRRTGDPGRGRLLAGGVLIGIGLLFLLDRFSSIWWLDFWRLWPLLLIAAGVALLRRSRHDRSDAGRAQTDAEEPSGQHEETL